MTIIELIPVSRNLDVSKAKPSKISKINEFTNEHFPRLGISYGYQDKFGENHFFGGRSPAVEAVKQGKWFQSRVLGALCFAENLLCAPFNMARLALVSATLMGLAALLAPIALVSEKACRGAARFSLLAAGAAGDLVRVAALTTVSPLEFIVPEFTAKVLKTQLW